MQVWFIAVLLAVAVATSVAAEVVAKAKTEVEAVTDVPEADDEVKVETVGEEDESETEVIAILFGVVIKQLNIQI